MELDLAEYGKIVNTATTSENPDRFVGPKVLLKRGDIGPDVAALQQYLVDAGVTSITKVDGAFGINTEKGVQEFQKNVGQPETGNYVADTRSALRPKPRSESKVFAKMQQEEEDKQTGTTPSTGGVYSVKAGDTLSGIAAENTFTLAQLKAANPDIIDPSAIVVGQEINFPVEGASAADTTVVETQSAVIIEDQLAQDTPVSEMGTIIEPPEFLGDGERINEATSSGQVSGITKNYSLNGVERSIIDVSETTVSDPSLSYPAEPSADPVDVQNVVLHYTGSLYKNGVRHYMNSFSKAASAAYFVDRSGRIYETFDPTVKGYHVHGSLEKNPRGIITNGNSIGVEVEASDTNLPTEAQLEATAWLSDYIIAQYGAQRVVAHPQANIHKGHVEGYDLVNYWRSRNNLPELVPSTVALENLFTLAPTSSKRPTARPSMNR